MEYVIRNEGWFKPEPCPIEGQYLIDCDVNGQFPGGDWGGPGKAKRFASHLEAVKFTQQERHEKRADGQPDRPLTAFNLLIMPLEDALAETIHGA